MSGEITGGWGFVWAAYLVTATVLTIYTITVFVRLRAERKRLESEPAGEVHR